MNPHVANLINAMVLIGISFWVYIEFKNSYTTVLIATIIGVTLLLYSPELKK